MAKRGRPKSGLRGFNVRYEIHYALSSDRRCVAHEGAEHLITLEAMSSAEAAAKFYSIFPARKPGDRKWFRLLSVSRPK
jgi:hypothetical protein